MELETVIYLFIALLLIYYFMTCSNEHFDQKECSRSNINNQFYHYNVNTINRQIRPY
jgi:hypothetical protein